MRWMRERTNRAINEADQLRASLAAVTAENVQLRASRIVLTVDESSAPIAMTARQAVERAEKAEAERDALAKKVAESEFLLHAATQYEFGPWQMTLMMGQWHLVDVREDETGMRELFDSFDDALSHAQKLARGE